MGPLGCAASSAPPRTLEVFSAEAPSVPAVAKSRVARSEAGIIHLQAPLARQKVEEAMRRFWASVQGEDRASLAKLLRPDAVFTDGVNAPRPLLSEWSRRFDAQDCQALSVGELSERLRVTETESGEIRVRLRVERGAPKGDRILAEQVEIVWAFGARGELFVSEFHEED